MQPLKGKKYTILELSDLFLELKNVLIEELKNNYHILNNIEAMLLLGDNMKFKYVNKLLKIELNLNVIIYNTILCECINITLSLIRNKYKLLYTISYENNKLIQLDAKYYFNDDLHRLLKPASIEIKYNYIEYIYYKNGEEHNAKGPSYLYYTDNILMEDCYCIHDKNHRLDGPAINIYNKDGIILVKEYFIHGKFYTEMEYIKYIRTKKFKFLNNANNKLFGRNFT